MALENANYCKKNKSLMINEYAVIVLLFLIAATALLLSHFIDGTRYVSLVVAIVMLAIAIKVLPRLEELSIFGYKIRLQAKIAEAEELIQRLDDLYFETKVLELNSKMSLPRGNWSQFIEPRVDILVAYCEKALMENVSRRFKQYLLNFTAEIRNYMFENLKDNSGSISDDLQDFKTAILNKKMNTTDKQLSEYINNINKLDDLCNLI